MNHHHQSCITAINLNNHGALQLEQGDAASALDSLSQAARLLLTVGPQQPTADGNNNIVDDDDIGMVVGSGYGMSCHTTLLDAVAHWHWMDCSRKGDDCCHDATSTTGSKEGSTPFLFMRAIVISHSSSMSLSPSSVSSISIPILFNLALCCTILGIRLGELPGRGFIEMAHDLYERVQQLVEQMDMVSSTSTVSSYSSSNVVRTMLLLLSMAIANNRACIYFTIKSMPQATLECLNRLATMLEWSTPMGLRAQDRGDLMLNLQILSTSQTIAAAA